jgi:ankyrin repeat protein
MSNNPPNDANSFEHRMRLAIIENNIETFIQLLGVTNEEQLANAQRKTCDKCTRSDTIFLLCAINGRCEMLEYLLNIPNIDVNHITANGYNALAQIVRHEPSVNVNNLIKSAKLLILNPSFDVTSVDCSNQNLLMRAVHDARYWQITRMLLKRAEINLCHKDVGGATALVLAVEVRVN